MKRIEAIIKDIVIGDPENPALFVYSGEKEKGNELMSMVFKNLLGVEVIPSENEKMEKVREIVKSESDIERQSGLKNKHHSRG
jgi:hypothetical protein